MTSIVMSYPRPNIVYGLCHLMPYSNAICHMSTLRDCKHAFAYTPFAYTKSALMAQTRDTRTDHVTSPQDPN